MDRELPWPVVPLRQWSDIIFLEWSHLTADSDEKRKGMKCVVQATIMNTISRDVIFKALEDDGRTDGPPKWKDAEEILMETNKGKVCDGNFVLVSCDAEVRT